MKIAALAVLFCCLSGIGVQAQAPTNVRVAVVIGNAAYVGAPLVNPINDARAIAAALRKLGFSVVELKDGNKQDMIGAISQAHGLLKEKQGVGLLYYAGHGLQLNWRNYMVPVDARLATASDVVEQTIDVGNAIEAFKSAGTRINILILDACRDNPFGAASSGKGLSQLDAPAGTMIAFATAPGNVAEDGTASSGNGLYTQYLLAELGKEPARIEDVFMRVRLNVRKQSQGRQVPWESTSMEDIFSFGMEKSDASTPLDATAREMAFNQEKREWDRIRNSKEASEFYAFLQKYPNGSLSELAQAVLDRLDKAKIVSQPDRNGEVQADAIRHRHGDFYEFNIKDGLTGRITNRTTARVTVSGEDRIEVSGPGLRESYTLAGALLSTEFGTYDPPITTVPGSEFRIGKKWAGRSLLTRHDGRKIWIDYQVRVVARESVEVPAGKFDAYKIETNTSQETGQRVTFVSWAQPDWGLSIKNRRESRSARGTLEVIERELVARRRGGN